MPGKNLRMLAGRPLVAWAVEAARGAGLVTRVVGSTDDEEIARTLISAGAEVPVLRPRELAGDDVPDAPVFLHVLKALESEGYVPDIVVNVRPTAPLRRAADIDGAVDTLVQTPSARSVKAVSQPEHHPYKMWTMGEGGLLEPLLPQWRAEHGDDPDVPRQRLRRVYRSSGAVDAVWVDALKETGMFHPGPVAAFELEAARDIDIDTLDDFRRVEAILQGDTRG